MSSPTRESSGPSSSSRYPPSSSSSRGGGGDNGGSPDRRYSNYGKERGGSGNNNNSKSGGNYNNNGPPYPYPPHAYGYPGSYGGYPPLPYGYAGAYGGYPPPPPPYGYPGYYPPASNNGKQPPVAPQPSPPRSTRSPDKSATSTPNKKNSSVSVHPSPTATKGTFSPKDKTPIKESPPEAQDEDLSVDPMRSDFHFYAMDNKDKYYELAKKTVHSIVGKENIFLTMTHLNEQLKEAWENESAATKELYMTKEEQDRKRFMLEDEIASRHCATLTARAKSPKTPKTKEESDPNPKKIKLEADNNPSSKRASGSSPIESV